MTTEPLKANARSRAENGEEEFEIPPAQKHGFLNSPHTSVREKRIGRENYTRQSNVN